MSNTVCSTAGYNADIAKRLNITARRGDTFPMITNVTDINGIAIDLSGYTFNMDIKVDEESSDAVLSTTNNTISVVGTSLGVLTVNITASNMSNISAGDYVYDIEAIDGNGVKRTWLYGFFCVIQDITSNL